MNKILLILFLYSNTIIFGFSSQTINCVGHDACKNDVWSGEYNIECGASNSERTCRSTTLNCAVNGDCTIKTKGSGHDAYQSSTVNAKESNSFKLTCQASGQRDCKTITIWCPQKSGSTCECVSCPSTVIMKCVQGISCTSVSNANIEYVTPDKYIIPDTIWDKDSAHTGQRPDCIRIFIPGATNNQNYKWGTLEKCKQTCIEEPTGRCNMISRYGESTYSATESWHCRFYGCPNPNNFNWVTQSEWGNKADECNTYKMPIRHFTMESRYQNVTQYINKTNYINQTVKILQYINTSKYYYDEEIIKNICIEGQFKYYDGNTNEAWTRKSWLLGCNQYLLGYKTLNQCKSQCNCNKSPGEFSSHSKYKQCSKTEASSNYLPCRQNSCSGGNCCSRSTAICKTACKAYYAIKFDGNHITYKDIIKTYNYTQYINKTQYITKNLIRYHDMIRNITRYTNVTNEIINEIINYINKTLYINKTRYKIVYNNITLYNNKTNFIDKILWINKTNFIDKILWINKTNYVDKILWINKTNYIDKILLINKTNYIDKILLINKTNYVDKIQHVNNTNYIEVIIPIYKNITNCNPEKKKADFIRVQPTRQIYRENTSINFSNTTNYNQPINFIFRIGFFIAMGIIMCLLLIIIYKCWIKKVCKIFCINIDKQHDEEQGIQINNLRLNTNPIYQIKEDIERVTPNGTIIRKRKVEI